MSKPYRPALPFSTALILLKPTSRMINGVSKKTFPAVENGVKFFGSFKTYGGTEKVVNGILSISDTAEVETWFRPDITSDCNIVIAGTSARYEILNEPENINRRNQFLKFKIQRIEGGV